MTYGDGRAWRAGPHRVYRRFAATAVDTLAAVSDLTAVDVGAGTGAMGEELAARGARVVYADRSVGMVREAPAPRLAGDIRALPIQSRRVDLVAAGFVLSHVDDPGTALAELKRIVRPGGWVVATSFAAAALGAEGLAADVTMLVGNGYVPGHADYALDLLRGDAGVRALFERRLDK